MERGDFSWSLENVSVPRTREVLAEYAARFPELIGWTTLDAAEFGAAQTRIRLIAGPPRLIAVLLPATHFKNQTRNRNGNPCLRSVENQSFTVCASHALTWSDRDGATCRVMTPSESAILMGFGYDWRLPAGSRAGQRAVGNALCVAMSRAAVQAALHLYAGTPTTMTPTMFADPGHTIQIPNGATRCQFHSLLSRRAQQQC